MASSALLTPCTSARCAAPRLAGPSRSSSAAAPRQSGSGVRRWAPQSQRFRVNTFGGAGLPGTGGGAGEPDLPSIGIPAPEFGGQEVTPREPDNPLPEGLPPNHPQGLPDETPAGAPEPEVPIPKPADPGNTPSSPPSVVPMPSPTEVPQWSAPTEVPGSPSPPEFTPGVPSEMPGRGGSEISFPS